MNILNNKAAEVFKIACWLIVPGATLYAASYYSAAKANEKTAPLSDSSVAFRIQETLTDYKVLYSTVPDIAAGRYRTSNDKSKYRALIFVDSTCDVCKRLLSKLARLPVGSDAVNISVIVLNHTKGGLENRRIPSYRGLTIYYASPEQEKEISKIFGKITTFPSSFLLDSGSRVVYVSRGLVTDEKGEDNVTSTVRRISFLQSNQTPSRAGGDKTFPRSDSPSIRRLNELSESGLVVGMYCKEESNLQKAKIGLLQLVAKSPRIKAVCISPSGTASNSGSVISLKDEGSYFGRTLGIRSSPVFFLMHKGFISTREGDKSSNAEVFLEQVQQSFLVTSLINSKPIAGEKRVIYGVHSDGDKDAK